MLPGSSKYQPILQVTQLSLRHVKETLIKATNEAAKVLTAYFNQPLVITHKEGVNNLVTEADHKSEAVIIGIIKESFPGHHILTEESGDLSQESEYKWIIDLIDLVR